MFLTVNIDPVLQHAEDVPGAVDAVQVDDPESWVSFRVAGLRTTQVLHLCCDHCRRGSPGRAAPGGHHLPGLQHEEDDEGQ